MEWIQQYGGWVVAGFTLLFMAYLLTLYFWILPRRGNGADHQRDKR